MKSRKLKAIFAALSAVAVMATAMTGFAAATTTYDVASNKVIVTETVKADPGKEVTYLVKSNNQIVYIDQATADNYGVATFSYKIADAKLVDANYVTAATFGTDGVNAVTEGSPVLPLKKFDNVDATEYTVTFTKAVAGSKDTANATIVAKEGYEITAVKINGEVQDDFVGTVALKIGDVLVVEAAKEQKDVEIIYSENTVDEVNNTVTCVMTYTGDNGEIGVICGDFFYPAVAKNNTKAAVQLKLPAKVKAAEVTVTATEYIED